MRTTIILFITMFCCLAALGQSSKATIVPENLTVEYIATPLGLDEPKPRFSWTLRAANTKAFGQKQSAYRIIVSSNLQNVNKNIGDEWDSRWNTSNQMNLITYEGKNLQSDKTYYWRLQVKDEKGNIVQANIEKWSTGLFSKSDWTAKWIGANEVFDPQAYNCNIYDPWFRKSFNLKSQPTNATIFIASVGYHELYVNGEKIGDHILAPAVTDHSKRARYLAYDIAKALKPGKNVIAIWLGTSWSIYAPYKTHDKPAAPIVLAQADIYEAGGHKTRITTDASWKMHLSPNKLLGNWSFRNMGGEIYDARKEVKDWNAVNFNDGTWSNALEFNPKLQLSAQNVEANKLFEVIKPVVVEDKGNNIYRVDMGINFAGVTKINVQGNAGDTVWFLISERVQDEMTYNNHSAYVIGASGKGVFQNRFNYGSGRWITIKGLKYKPMLSDVTGWQVRTAYPKAGTFKSSNDLQNWVYDKVKWNYQNLTIGGYVVDCPQRERMGYGGDAHATSEAGMFNFKLGAFYTKWMQDWRDVQGTESMVGNMNDTMWARKGVTSGRKFNNGVLPHTAPTYWGGGGPAWGGICISLPWYVYLQYGDKRILENNFEMMQNWLAFLDLNTKNNLLQRFGGDWDFLGDWLWPNATAEGMNNDKPETLCLNNCFRVYNLRTAAKAARVLGKNAEADKYEQQANISSQLIHENFFNKTDDSYADSSMTNMAAALLAEVTPLHLRQAVMNRIAKEILVVRKGHIHAGITGGTILFKVLRDAGRDDLIYSMTSQTTYPSWGYMRANNATSLWEMWEKDLEGHSLLHSSFLYPGPWYIDGVAGIRLNEAHPGFQKFIIRVPNFNEDQIAYADGTYNSSAGLIKSNWQKKDGRLTLQITVPPNSSATVKIPSTVAKKIKEITGKAKRSGEKDGFTLYEVEAGEYIFK